MDATRMGAMRVVLAFLLMMTGAAWGAPGLGAQELSLQRELPPSEDASPCEPLETQPRSIEEEDRLEADRLAGDAARQMILGERTQALELLTEAARLDPASPSIRFQLAQALEDAGDEAGALDAFCHYLALDPDAPERAEVEARIARLSVPAQGAVPELARLAFREGLEHFDRGAYDDAVREFSRALVEVPDWADAHYNRGVAYLRAGREGAGLSDLEQYLELEAEGERANRVRLRLGAVAPSAPTYSPGTALAVGVLMPGMGHFYSGRPAMGTIYLLGAGAGAAAGLLYRRVEVSCRTIPGPDGCPPDQIAEEKETQPLLVPGLAGAAGLTLIGAIHAYVSTRSRSAPRSSALLFELPASPGSTLSVDPVLHRGDAGIQARLRLPLR